MGVDELERSLAALLAADGKTEIVGLRRLSGGASRETWSFDAVADGEGRGLILQRLRPGVTESSSGIPMRSEEHTSELQSLMRISYAVFCLKKNTHNRQQHAANQ